MSSRLTSQKDGETPENRTTPDFSKFNVCDSFTNSISSPPDGGEERHRLSRQRLEEAEERLGERDRQILTAVQRYRYLLTSQIQRLYFTEAATPTAAHRAAVRALQKLKDIAYGSNLNLEQMKHRCPTAEVVGATMLHNWRLRFRGGSHSTVATVERGKGYKVPVLVWQPSRGMNWR